MCSVVARIARGHGFESRSGHGFFTPVTCMIFKTLEVALYFHIKCGLVVYMFLKFHSEKINCKLCKIILKSMHKYTGCGQDKLNI